MATLKFSHLQVNGLTLSNLAGLTDETLNLVTPVASTLGDAISQTAQKLTDDILEMKTDMDKQRKSIYTPLIKNENDFCDANLEEIKRTTKAALHSAIAGRAEAGEKLMFFLEPFWNLNKLPLLTQISITAELLTRYTGDAQLGLAAAALGIEELFTLLATHNTLLHDYYNERINEHANATPAATSIRSSVENGYVSLCILVERTVSVEPVSPANVFLFNQMDGVRKKFSALSPAKIDIRNAVTQPVATQTYTGKVITPIPELAFEGKELAFTVDFDLSYRNNINAGEATIIIHGKGRFNGRNERKFNIEHTTVNPET
jgi:hypothetical protein